MALKIQYNAPVVLTFTLISAILFFLDNNLFNSSLTRNLLTLRGTWDWSDPFNYLRLALYPVGHADASHLIGNFSLFLLIAPIMEEKYGSKKIFEMMLATTIITGIIQVLVFNTGLLGASGLVFMFIVLVSFADVRHGSIPLTFILVIFFFIGKEVINSTQNDSISQYAHIMGGIMGALYGFSEKKA